MNWNLQYSSENVGKQENKKKMTTIEKTPMRKIYISVFDVRPFNLLMISCWSFTFSIQEYKASFVEKKKNIRITFFPLKTLASPLQMTIQQALCSVPIKTHKIAEVQREENDRKNRNKARDRVISRLRIDFVSVRHHVEKHDTVS